MDKYTIEINESNRYCLSDDCFEIGCVIKNGERFVPILNKGKDIKNGYSMAITYNGEELLIHMDKTYKGLLYNNINIVKPLIFHEIGHFENGDFYNDPVPSELRAAMLEMGQVMPRELAADKFAAKIVGKEALIKSLRYLLDLRKKGSSIIMDYSQLANIKELELRIKNLK